MTRFTFGPIHSRRLGMSLGINVLAPLEEQKKRCTFNCAYCEIGRSKPDEVVPVTFRYIGTDVAQFRAEVEPPIVHLPEIDSATFGYMGETTLAAGLEEYLDAVRAIKEAHPRADGGPRISIFTNSTTLGDPGIRRVLARFDFVMAKLDCALQPLFLKVNRPDRSVPPVATIIENLALLKQEIQGCPPHQLAIQTLLFKSMNPSIPSNMDEQNIAALAEAYGRIGPHVVQVYTVARDPAENGIYAISAKDKEYLRQFFKQHVKRE
ncbi:MAG: hypothetical protein JW839_14150, partial [Candidatus Lokiarchaeota archaeon]|nr:hypothetical protein [Candidatus Lokiarchaeota archaeon]